MYHAEVFLKAIRDKEEPRIGTKGIESTQGRILKEYISLGIIEDAPRV